MKGEFLSLPPELAVFIIATDTRLSVALRVVAIIQGSLKQPEEPQ